MKKKNQIEWVNTTQKSVPLLSRYIATKYSLGRYISETSLHNLKINHYRYINDNNYVQAFFSKEEIKKLYPVLWEAIVTGRINNFLKDYKNCGLELLNFSRTLKNKNLSILSSSELSKVFEEWTEQYTKFLAYIYNGNFSVNIATEKLLETLSKEKEDDEFRILTEPVEEIDIKHRQERILSVLEKIGYPEKPFPDLSELPLEIREELLDIHETYRYLGSIFLTTNNYPYFEDFLEEIKTLSKYKKEKRIGLQKQKQKIIRKLGINEEIRNLINELTRLAYYRTELLSYVQRAEYYSVGLFEEIARRLSISYKHLVHMTDEEINESMLVPEPIVPVKEIEARFENYHVSLKNGKINLSKPKKTKEDMDNVSELKGTCASQGKVTGRVRIIRNSSEISKMKRGEVLVTFMTTPDYIMGMQKAAAIVTNDGGLTCHAAIVSRELGVPCIVGTENATRILKDRDLVEVNATKGIIKIIKRARSK